MHPLMRKKAAGWVHQYLRPYLKDLKVITLKENEFLAIRLDIYDNAEKDNWDVSNKWPWIKWFEDTLVELKKVPDDCIKYIRSSGHIVFNEIPMGETKKLKFTITKYATNQKAAR